MLLIFLEKEKTGGNMLIVNVASEINPYAKTGGLADVTGSMPLFMSDKNTIILFMPLYANVEKDFSPEIYSSFSVEMGFEKKTAVVKKLEPHKNITVFFIGEYNYFERDKIYGDYSDDAERFSFFSKSVLIFLKKEKINPDVIHCHDWQTGILPLFAREDDYFDKSVLCYTIHNIAFQGNFPYEKMFTAGIDTSYFSYDKIEFFGNISFMKAGIIYSDFVNTVSSSYRDETLTSEYGFGMQHVLNHRKFDYYGVVNGIDYKEWDSQKDKNIVKNYSSDDISGKKINKQAIMKEYFPEGNTQRPLFTAVTRLAFQKGIELIIKSIPELALKDCYIIILGSGDENYEKSLENLEKNFRSNFKFIKGYDFSLSHKLYSSSDFFLMPSLFEPCGLSQLISLRYGTIPVVRKTGGLKDTVRDVIIDEKEGNGFVFEKMNITDFNNAIENAVTFYSTDRFEALQKKVMKVDYSWKVTSDEYIKLYTKYRK